MPFVKANREPKYLRNTVWQYLRRTSLVTQQYFLLTNMQFVQEKVDENRKTGVAGGREEQLSEVDERVLDILGRDNPTIIGICDDHEGEMVPLRLFVCSWRSTPCWRKTARASAMTTLIFLLSVTRLCAQFHLRVPLKRHPHRKWPNCAVARR